MSHTFAAQSLRAHERPTAESEATYRYGVTFLIILARVMFEIVAPAGDGERSIAIDLAGAALIVAVATWRTRTRRRSQLTLALRSLWHGRRTSWARRAIKLADG